ncbi:MAG: redox-sensing transcriptional repressor Rex [Candidatus Omnitrophota bacterium]
MIVSRIRAASRSTLKRLPLYLHLLERVQALGEEYISCTRIAEEFDFDPTLVRKDIEVTGAVGVARIGFRVSSLVGRIKEFLGWNNAHDAFLVGAGNLGKALLGYKDFEKYGLNIVAAFDDHPRKVGTMLFGKEVLPLSRLPAIAKKMRVSIGIVTVPAEQAQGVVDQLLAAGIKAIWNFAPAPLKIPGGIILENARLTQSLAVLTTHLTRM